MTACATTEIINEYEEIVQEMIDRKQGHINRTILNPLINRMLTGKEICPLEETVNICVFICLCSFQVRISYLYYAIV